MRFIEDNEIVLTTASDYLNTTPYAEALVEAIKSAPSGFNIGLFGEWGGGKSSVIKTTKAALELSKGRSFHVFVYDAWKYSSDSFRRMFLLELQRDLKLPASEKFESFYADTTEDTKINRVVKKGPLFLLFGFALILLLVSFFLPSQSSNPIAMLAAIAMVFIALYKDMFQDMKIVVHKPRLFAPEQFQDCYAELISTTIKAKTTKQKISDWFLQDLCTKKFDNLVIVIDNLDRCDRQVAYELLSDIKNFLGQVDGVFFVIPMDDRSIKKHLATFYKNDEKAADEFLRKLFNVTFKLKPFEPIDLFEFTEKILKDNNVYLKPETIDAISKEYASNPRRIIQVINNLQAELQLLEKSGAQDIVDHHETIVAIMIIIREEWPNLYIELFKNPVALSDLSVLPDDKYANEKVFLRRVHGLLTSVDANIIERIINCGDSNRSVSSAFLSALKRVFKTLCHAPQPYRLM